jgi:type I restriction enzyme S subunit
MSSRPGYKQTEIGEIPEEWKICPISAIFDVETGTTPSTKVAEYWMGGDINWLTPSDLSNLASSIYIDESERKITQKALRDTGLGLAPRGSVIISTRAPVGYVAVIRSPSTFNQGCKVLVSKHDEVAPEFYCYLLISKKAQLQGRSGGSTFLELSKESLERFPVPLPPLPEQKKIASILSTVDDAIQKTDEIIAKTERLKKGLMQRLLTRGIGHTKFKQTEVGETPEEWEVVKLGDLVTYQKGKAPRTILNELQDDLLPYLTVETLRTRVPLQWTDEREEVVKVDPDEIILIWDGFYSGEAFIGFQGVLPSTAVKISPASSAIDKGFLFYFLKSRFKELNSKVAGMYLKHVSKFVFESLGVPLPSLPEQKKIATILSTVDEQIEKERAKKGQLEQLKKGLMQVLLTGKVRVKVN